MKYSDQVTSICVGAIDDLIIQAVCTESVSTNESHFKGRCLIIRQRLELVLSLVDPIFEYGVGID